MHFQNVLTYGARVAAGCAGIGQLDAGAFGQALNGFDEGYAVHLHEELKNVAGFPAPKAVIAPHRRANVETGGAFVVEGAQALHRVDSRALERHVFADDFVDPRARPNLVDVLPADKSCHGAYAAYNRVAVFACILWYSAQAEWSVSEATWSTTMRTCALSSSASR